MHSVNTIKMTAFLIMNCAAIVAFLCSFTFGIKSEPQCPWRNGLACGGARPLLALTAFWAALMCYRFFLRKSDLARAAEALSAALRAEFSDRHNIAPSSSVAVVTPGPVPGSREVAMMRWGLVPSWARSPEANSPSLANARADSLETKPSFRAPFRRHRCILPAGGFFEWESLSGGRKQPWLFRRTDGAPLLFAGIWDQWKGSDGRHIESCAIVTTEPNSLVGALHDRMPVCLQPDEAIRWIETAEASAPGLASLLRPAPDPLLECFRVDPRMNSVRVDDPACLAPLSPPEDAPGDQLPLGLE